MRLIPSAETRRIWRKRWRKRMRHSRLRPSRVRRMVGSLPPLWAAEQPATQPNTLFSRSAVRSMRGHIQRISHRDRYLLDRMSEPRIGGVRDWEYGTLLGLLTGRPPAGRALDVGSGRSTFPTYLLEHGLTRAMTTLDLDSAHERQWDDNVRDAQAAGVDHVQGSMLELPFAAGAYDLVTCISAIEHLDGSPKQGTERPPHDRFVDDTRRAITEMARVVAPGGLLFVTTDAYLPDRQTTDAWSSPSGERPIWSAYHFADIEPAFLVPVREAGLELIGKVDYRERLLLDSADRATYRGRYFSTFAVAARRPG